MVWEGEPSASTPSIAMDAAGGQEHGCGQQPQQSTLHSSQGTLLCIQWGVPVILLPHCTG